MKLHRNIACVMSCREFTHLYIDHFQISFEKAKELLSSQNIGNELPQARAEELRKRATQLLHKTQRHRSDISRMLHRLT